MLNKNRFSIVPTIALAAAMFAASFGAHAEINQPNGMIVQAQVGQRDIKVDSTTKYVNVQRGEVVRFVTEQGNFSWSFDTASNRSVIDLAQITPQNINAHGIKVYVANIGDEG